MFLLYKNVSFVQLNATSHTFMQHCVALVGLTGESDAPWDQSPCVPQTYPAMITCDVRTNNIQGLYTVFSASILKKNSSIGYKNAEEW